MDYLYSEEQREMIFIYFLIAPLKTMKSLEGFYLSKEEEKISRANEAHAFLKELLDKITNEYELYIYLNKVKEKFPKLENNIEKVKEKHGTSSFLNRSKDIFYNFEISGKEVKVDEKKEEIKKTPLIISESDPINSEDLYFLNQLSGASAKTDKEFKEIESKFNTQYYKEQFIRLYKEKPRYFEIAFGNIEYDLQNIILDIVSNDKFKSKLYEDELKDINLLSNIDELLNKSKSFTSRQQAFGLVIKLFDKNINKNLIENIIKGDIILNTLTSLQTPNKEKEYAFKRMFTALKYPYNKLLLDNYSKMMKMDQDALKTFIINLSSDRNFKKSYDKLKVAEESLRKRKFIEDFFANPTIDAETYENIQEIYKIISTKDYYNDDIISQEFTKKISRKINEFLYLNDLSKEDKYKKLIDKNFINKIDPDRRHNKDTDITNVYGIMPNDIWLEISTIIDELEINGIKKVFMRYDSNQFFEFTPGKKLTRTKPEDMPTNFRSLPKGYIFIPCFDPKSKNHESYFNALYTRIYSELIKSCEVKTMSKYDNIKTMMRNNLAGYLTNIKLIEKDTKNIDSRKIFCSRAKENIRKISEFIHINKGTINRDNINNIMDIGPFNEKLSIFLYERNIVRISKYFENIGPLLKTDKFEDALSEYEQLSEGIATFTR